MRWLTPVFNLYIMKAMKKVIRKFVPKWLINLYHGLWSFLSAAYYRLPSRKMVVIGVTGTNGKSTTVNLIAHAIEVDGKVCAASTVNFKIAEKEWLNTYKMTTLGRHHLQKFLRQAVDAGCKYAVLEMSSEALAQRRHWGLYFDVAVFTNLTPEHIDSHGNFYNYRAAKKILFESLDRRYRKKIDGQIVSTVVVVNSDDPHAPYYLHTPVDRKITYGLSESPYPHDHFQATDVKVSMDGIIYKIVNDVVSLKLKGKFDVYNSLAALCTVQMLDIPMQTAQARLAMLEGVPGRLEVITTTPFTVLVDYAPEPESLRQVYETIELWQQNFRIIHILGSTGGGRDVSRRSVLGEIAGQNADIAIITNEDPYDDDPQKIIDEVAEGAIHAGKKLSENLFKILDRREAINRALSLAKPGDLVLITGKGAEQKMAVKGGYVDWDDRIVIREELKKIT